MKSLTRWTMVAAALTLLLSDNASAAESPSLEIAGDSGRVTIRNAGMPVLEYVAGTASRPYVRELYTPNGVQILRDSSPEHKHHHGLMFALGVNGVDFWSELPGAGAENEVGACDTAISEYLGASCVQMVQTLDWNDSNGKGLLREHRRLGVVPMKTSLPVTMVLWESELSVAQGVDAVELDGHSYYGLGMRFVAPMDSGGRFFNASNQPGDIVRGSERLVTAKWCAYTAAVGEKRVTVAIFDHPANPRHPNQLFYMSEPFAYLAATLNLWKEVMAVKADDALRLHYAVAVWDGEIAAAEIELLYEAWCGARFCRCSEE